MPGLYIHIPFCERKCVYCSFYSIETFDGKDRFLRSVEREIAARKEDLDRRGIALPLFDTIFFGGGTPSLLTPDEIEGIIRALRASYEIDPEAEVTMECNPGTLDPKWLQGYRDLGVNRLSFGVQSFHDDELRFLSRIHTADQAVESIGLARRYFENVSLDLIFALPNQTVERWRSNLRKGVELGTGHISAYSLIFEEGTPLNAMRLAGQVRPAPDGLEADMYEETMRTLADVGFQQYEVSNYARPGYRCRHNLGYWERSTYLAFGPSAHGFVREGNPPFRWANAANLRGWLEDLDKGTLPTRTIEELGLREEIEETVYLGLRSRGISLEEFRTLAGVDLIEVAPGVVEQMIDRRHGEMGGGRLRLTISGYPFADRYAVTLIERIEQAYR